MRRHGVRCLLMGGQACVFYGAAEFSRDTDLAILTSPPNLDRFRAALADLRAERIAVPPFEASYLERGHAVHFRCHHPDADGMRIDIMSVMRGVAPFDQLWDRRTAIEVAGGESYDLLSLGDLVQAKKTQRDRDWPMLRRLVEVHYLANREAPTPERIDFWLRELRTPALLAEVASMHPARAGELSTEREALVAACSGSIDAIAEELASEERRERNADRAYWEPLRRELEALRHQR
ncbi:MAG: hypothetical protein AB1806_05685 [Acidobacteriota bacterium]